MRKKPVDLGVHTVTSHLVFLFFCEAQRNRRMETSLRLAKSITVAVLDFGPNIEYY